MALKKPTVNLSNNTWGQELNDALDQLDLRAPIGGAAGQVQVKKSNADYDTGWATLDQLVAALVSTSGSATRAAVATLTNTGSAAPGTVANITAPSIAGTPTVGSLLSAQTGTWNPTPDGFQYQWQRTGNAISGQTGATYTVVQADVGATITVAVTATKSGYYSSPPTVTVGVTGQAGATTPTTNNLLTESGDSLTTESGDLLVTA